MKDFSDGKIMHSAGSIQPSDYDSIRKLFNIVSATKRLTVNVSLAKPFSCSVYFASEPKFYSDKISSELVSVNVGGRYHRVEQQIDENILSDSRARYFSLVVFDN